MALYYNLPVYKESYDLLLQVYTAVKKTAREYKFTYWSSTVSGTNASNRNFNSGGTNTNNNNRANGLTVRCLKD